MDEQRLIARILDGHESDYGYFLERYGGEVFAIVSRLVPNREDAEDDLEVYAEAHGMKKVEE